MQSWSLINSGFEYCWEVGDTVIKMPQKSNFLVPLVIVFQKICETCPVFYWSGKLV